MTIKGFTKELLITNARLYPLPLPTHILCAGIRMPLKQTISLVNILSICS